MKKKLKTYIILLILSLSLTSCSILGIDGTREEDYISEIERKDEEIEKIKDEKEFIEEDMEVFLRLKEIDNKSFRALENEANQFLIDYEGKDPNANALNRIKNTIKELPQNLVFEKASEDGDTKIDIARSHRQRDDLLVSIESDLDKIKYISILGSIETEEKAGDTLLLMSMILEELFPNRHDILDYIDNYIEGIENKDYRKNYNVDGKALEFRTSNNPKEKLYGHISLSISY